MSTTLKKITARAKQIRKKHPNKKWTTAVKEAGREYREGGIAGRKPKRKTTVKTSTRRTQTIGTVHKGAGLESMLRKQLKEQLGWILVSIEQARTKTEKNKLRRKAVVIRRKLRALS